MERIIPDKIPFAVLLDGSIYSELLFDAIHSSLEDPKRLFPIALRGEFFYNDFELNQLQKKYKCQIHGIQVSPEHILEDIDDIMFATETSDPAKIFEASLVFYGILKSINQILITFQRRKNQMITELKC